jgi:DNA-binding NarL/FixJ family response regulator
MTGYAPRLPLTPSEARALALFAAGASRDDVALAMTTSSTTVRDMLAVILDKLGAASRAEAVAIWRGDRLHAALYQEHARRIFKRGGAGRVRERRE